MLRARIVARRQASTSGRLVATAALAVWCGFATAERLHLNAAPIFLGGSSSNGLAIDVENDGPDARGVVRITSGAGATLYPIELPHGAHKHFTGYPLASAGGYGGYEPLGCDLDTDKGSIHFEVPFAGYGEAVNTVEITDDFGGLQFLKEAFANKPSGPQGSLGTPVYVTPEDAPGRLLAYREIATVVLGPGAERISDDAVRAITEYVLAGGRLMFVGGSAAATFQDVRWKALTPITNVHAMATTVSLHIGSAGIRSRMEVQVGTPVSGSWRAQGGVVRRAYGLGQVIALPFDLLEGPLKAWDGRAAYYASLMHDTGKSMFGYSEGADYMPGYVVRPGTYGGPGRTMYVPGATKEDPFNFKPPPPQTVGAIILAYLILVAPVNFLILRKLRRSELAWFTTPLISVIFAGFILRLASGLYFGKMMTSVNGTLLAVENAPTGLFRGSCELFFPSGGAYDLKLSDVDSIGAKQNFDYGRRPNGGDDMAVLDVGQMVVPDLNVRNLQFKELTFDQIVDTSGWFTFGIKRVSGVVKLTITNRSPYNLTTATAYAEGGSAPLADLPAGQSAIIDIRPGSLGKQYGPIMYGQVIHRAILEGELIGFRPGPQIGASVVGRDAINLVAVSDGSTESGGDL